MISVRRLLICSAAFLLLPGLSSAHSPHHVITDVAVSQPGESAGDVYILITDQVFRSDIEGSSWKNLVNGLNNQFSFTSLSISPAYDSDHTVFVASAGDGVFRSLDGGDSWQRASSGMESADIVELSISTDFENDRRLLAVSGSGGVWRSVDGADTWSMVLTENVRITNFAEIQGPGAQSTVFAGDSEGRLWHSGDNGRLWEIVFEFPDDLAITSIAGNGEDLYVGTRESGLHYSSDSGRSFTHVEQLQASYYDDCLGRESERHGSHITSIKLLPSDAGSYTVAVTTWFEGVFLSGDKGRSWTQWNEGLSCDRQANDMSEPHFRKLVLGYGADGEPAYWLGAFDGLFKSDGQGSQWRQFETLPLGLIKGMAVTEGAEVSPVIALSTYGGGFYISEDRGSDWVIGNKGLQTTRLTGLAFSTDFQTSGEIYAGASRRLLKSADRGHSWRLINLHKTSFGTRVLNKLERSGISTSWLRSSDKASTSPVYPTHIVALPEPDSDSVLFATRFHGVMSFNNSEDSVESVWAGTDQIMNSLAISPGFQRDGTLYSSIRDEGVFRSDDRGANWISVNEGLNFVGDWADHPQRGDFRRDAFVAMSPDFESDQTLFTGSPAGDGLYRSTDRGDSWARVRVGQQMLLAPVLAIAISPEFRNDSTLIVSIKGQGLFRSVDRGMHFDAIGEQLIADNASIELLQYSPNFKTDQSIVAASDEMLFLSEDNGDSWSEVKRPVRYEDMRDVVHFSGDWEQQRGGQFSAMTETVSSGIGDSVKLRFVGDGIRWTGSRGPGYGNAEVYIDNELAGEVRCHSAEREYMQDLFVAEGLGFGAHTVEIRLAPGQDSEGAGIVAVDSLDVLPARVDQF